MQQWLLRNNLCTRAYRVFWIFRKRIILSRFYFNGRHFNSTMQCLKPCWALPKLCTMWSVSSHEGTCRCNTSLGHVPATFSCVCKCFDYVPATCSRYTSAATCHLSVYYTRFSRCHESLQHDPSCLATFIVWSRVPYQVLSAVCAICRSKYQLKLT